jgi:hypothetical protein
MILKVPVYVPAGLAELLPTTIVPPTRNWVMKLQSPLTGKEDPLPPFSVGPILRVSVPPLLPVSMVEGGYVITTDLPWQRLISNIAAWGVGAVGRRKICPVEVLLPCQSTVIVPPELPEFSRQKDPKWRACVELTVMLRGGMLGCPLILADSDNSSNSPVKPRRIFIKQVLIFLI